MLLLLMHLCSPDSSVIRIEDCHRNKATTNKNCHVAKRQPSPSDTQIKRKPHVRHGFPFGSDLTGKFNVKNRRPTLAASKPKIKRTSPRSRTADQNISGKTALITPIENRPLSLLFRTSGYLAWNGGKRNENTVTHLYNV